jgi:serine/threonine protein kinase
MGRADHRDLKPANVLLAEQEDRAAPPRIKLADFGVSTLLARKDDLKAAPPPETASPDKVRVPTLAAALGDESEPGEVNTMTVSGRQAMAAAAAVEVAAAEQVAADARQVTQSGVLVGTPMYMAPELSEGSHRAKPAADIFSLGMIAFELYTGEIPFARPPVWARWRGSDKPAPSLADKRPELPAALVQLIDSCLQLDPALRPTAVAIAAGLRPFLGPL